VLAVAFIWNRNAAIGPPQLEFDTKFLRRHDVFLLLAWEFLTMLGYITLLYSLPDFSGSIALSKTQAGAIPAYFESRDCDWEAGTG